MLTITIPEIELFDDASGEFIYVDSVEMNLEHSLNSISKWESKWCKPFINESNKSVDEIIDYIKCMTLNDNIADDVYERLTDSNIIEINNYIELPMTATKFYNINDSGGGKKETITSELIYYWLISYNIPMECQTWHLNRLLTLVKVCNIKNNPPKKMSKREIYNHNRNLNAERKKQLKTNG